jgi:hypothetical protein
VEVCKENVMSWEQRIKYVQGGTGQVFYLYQDEQSNAWVIAMFLGGPQGVQVVGTWPTREAAEQQLAHMQCKSMG